MRYLLYSFAFMLVCLGVDVQSDELGVPLVRGYHGLLWVMIFSFLMAALSFLLGAARILGRIYESDDQGEERVHP